MASSVDGLVSGLDTTTLITQLLQLERQPQMRLQAKKTVAERAVSAYQQLNTKFAALRDAAAALSGKDDWKLTKATSSATDAVGVTSTTGASTGSLTFTVDRLAAAASRASSGTVASTSTVVATAPFSITKDGVTTTIDVGDGALATIVRNINESTAGVKAAAVQVAPDSYKLQLTSTTTGAASAFTTTLDPAGPLGSLDELVVGVDSQITVGGSAPGAYTVTSATNTVTDVLPGVTMTLKKADPAVNVTVDVAADADGLADRVSKLVDAANAAVKDIRTLSAAGKDGTGGGPLAADSIVRRLEQEVLNVVNGARYDGETPAYAGIEVTKQGTLTFTRSKFLDSYAADPAKVADLFQERTSTSTSNLRVASTGTTMAAGTYGVFYDSGPTAAVATGQVVTNGSLKDAETIRISVGGVAATYNASAGEALTSVANGLQAAFDGAGLALTATVESGALVVRSTATGTAATFTVEAAGSGNKQTNLVLGAYSGTDGAGHFTLPDGTVVAGTMVGNFLNAAGDSPLEGLSVEMTQPFVSGTLTYDPGMARRLEAVAELAIDGTSGTLKTAIDGRQSLVKDLTDRITAWDGRLARKETDLRRQFTALETALGRLRAQSSWLAGQLASLPTPN